MRTVALIPLRGGSKSIPYKNIKPIAGRPLCFWVLDACLNCTDIDEVYVSTEDERIRNVIASEFLKVKFVSRPMELAQDRTSTEAVMLHFASVVEFDLLVTVQATSPLTSAEDISRALALFTKERYDSMLTAVEFKRFLWEKDGTPINYDHMMRPRRQEFEGCLMENGAFYVTKRGVLIKERNRLGGKIGVYRMTAETTSEIDEPSDWKYIEHLLLQRRKTCDLTKIKLLVTDVDGTLTDGGMYYTAKGEECKKFNTRDGKGMAMARESGVDVCMMTAERSDIVMARAKKLGISDVHLGVKNKLRLLQVLCNDKGIGLENVLYVGDDLNDLECMKACGFSVCPADAAPEILEAACHVCKAKGGEGVVREAVDILLSSSRPDISVDTRNG